MFIRRCDNELPHESHPYQKHWDKAELTMMPKSILDRIPYDEWDANYSCPGIEQPIVWNVVYMHEDCPRCEDCAENAIDRCLSSKNYSGSWQELGYYSEVLHRAVVEAA